jgi:septum site-determining protein MinC
VNQKEPILVRGYRNGLYITVDESVPDEQLAEQLSQRLANLGSFVQGSNVLLEVGARSLDDDALRNLQKMFQRQYGMTIHQLIARSDQTRSAAEILRIRAVPTLMHREAETPTISHREPNALTIRQTLRSGASERYLDGSIVILGDVNPGAEVVAAGDVIVLGALRGVVHAGAMGDETAVVFALNLQATQLRVAHHIARSPEGGRRAAVQAEIACVDDGQIVVKAFQGF